MTESVAYPGGSARRQSIGEEVLNAISHGIGAVMAVIGTVLLVLRAKEEGDLLNIISVAIFGGSMILLYLISCLYHALPRSKGKQVFQILDHCSIFLLILGTYTPICLITVGGTFGLTIFGINLACGIVGIVLNAVSLKRWKKVCPGPLYCHGLAGNPGASYDLAKHDAGRAVPASAGRCGLYRGGYFLSAEGETLSPRYLAFLCFGWDSSAVFCGVYQLLRWVKEKQEEGVGCHERVCNCNGFLL